MANSFIHKCLWAAAIFAAMQLAACAPQQIAEGTGAVKEAEKAPEYKIANGEKLRVTVSGEDKLTGDYLVDPSGQIAFPLIGKVQTAGLTTHQLEVDLTTKLKGRYLVNPRVFVETLTQRPFYVIGEAKAPGEFPYKPGLNVISAVALAGGYTPRASSSYVYIRRASETVEKEYPADPAVLIYPGDIIRIPERYF